MEPVALPIATQRCETLIKDIGLPKSERAFYVNSCAADYSLTGNVNVAETARVAYKADCRAVLDTMATCDNPEKQAFAVATKQASGLGDVPCPGGCGVNGQCGVNACACSTGYGGDKCEFKLDEPQSIVSSNARGRFVGGVLLAVSAMVLLC